MIRFFTLGLFLFSIGSFDKNDFKELQGEINKEVWKPFKDAFETLDGEVLNTTYADKVLRVTPDGIDTENSLKAKNLESFMGY